MTGQAGIDLRPSPIRSLAHPELAVRAASVYAVSVRRRHAKRLHGLFVAANQSLATHSATPGAGRFVADPQIVGAPVEPGTSGVHCQWHGKRITPVRFSRGSNLNL